MFSYSHWPFLALLSDTLPAQFKAGMHCLWQKDSQVQFWVCVCLLPATVSFLHPHISLCLAFMLVLHSIISSAVHQETVIGPELILLLRLDRYLTLTWKPSVSGNAWDLKKAGNLKAFSQNSNLLLACGPPSSYTRLPGGCRFNCHKTEVSVKQVCLACSLLCVQPGR